MAEHHPFSGSICMEIVNQHQANKKRNNIRIKCHVPVLLLNDGLELIKGEVLHHILSGTAC